MARKGNLAFKIDLEKAYDSISWSFLRETLELYEFPLVIIDLIMCYVSSSQISLLWNGAPLPSFKPGRGLRQGDPKSPYFFVLCMERLSIHIQNLVEPGRWKPLHRTAGGTGISHLFFAGDVLLFCKASVAQVTVLVDALQFLCEGSVLRINVQKSKAITSIGVAPEVRTEIGLRALIPFVNDLGKYLGFPLQGRRLNSERCEYNFTG